MHVKLFFSFVCFVYEGLVVAVFVLDKTPKGDTACITPQYGKYSSSLHLSMSQR